MSKDGGPPAGVNGAMLESMSQASGANPQSAGAASLPEMNNEGKFPVPKGNVDLGIGGEPFPMPVKGYLNDSLVPELGSLDPAGIKHNAFDTNNLGFGSIQVSNLSPNEQFNAPAGLTVVSGAYKSGPSQG